MRVTSSGRSEEGKGRKKENMTGSGERMYYSGWFKGNNGNVFRFMKDGLERFPRFAFW